MEGVRYCHDQIKGWRDCQDVGEEAGTLIVAINIFDIDINIFNIVTAMSRVVAIVKIWAKKREL